MHIGYSQVPGTSISSCSFTTKTIYISLFDLFFCYPETCICHVFELFDFRLYEYLVERFCGWASINSSILCFERGILDRRIAMERLFLLFIQWCNSGILFLLNYSNNRVDFA
jgi:hypothetical protein